MTKLSLLGTASALALSFALAQGASATEPRLLVDDNQTNLLSDGNANDGSTINKSYTANIDNSAKAWSDDDKSASNSFNKSYTANTDASVKASSDNDTTTSNSGNRTTSNSFNRSESTLTDNRVANDNDTTTSNSGNRTASNSFNRSESTLTDNRVANDNDTTTSNSFNTSTHQDQRTSISIQKDERVSKAELEAEASDGSVAAVNGHASDQSIGRQNSGKIAGGDLNTGTQTDISLGDVMVNLASANAHLDSASMKAAFKADVDTGSINSVNLNGMHGIAQVNNNTGVAAQANNIALNAIVK
jgi:hypothetical protein